jgi:FtsH-binding integral membrane protein
LAIRSILSDVPQVTGYTLRVAALFAVGAVAAHSWEALYTFAWSHPTVMLVGQFALLAVGALTRPWALAAFWVFTGATAYALVRRAAADLHGGPAAALVAAAAAAVAFALFAHIRGESERANARDLRDNPQSGGRVTSK